VTLDLGNCYVEKFEVKFEVDLAVSMSFMVGPQGTFGSIAQP
jgi:hypothetical protein